MPAVAGWVWKLGGVIVQRQRMLAGPDSPQHISPCSGPGPTSTTLEPQG